MTTVEESKQKREGQTNAGLAGAGGGTLVTVIATSLPDSNVVKPPLLYLAPSISILLTALYVFSLSKIANYVTEREVKKLLQECRKTLQVIIADPSTSEEHRVYSCKQLEELDKMMISLMTSKIKSLKSMTSEDIEKKLKKIGRSESSKDVAGKSRA
jgi:hypothetical protein